MKKRMLSMLLCCIMLVGLFPSAASALGIVEFDDPQISGSALLEKMEQESEAVPEDVETPYGTEGTIKLLEKAELYYYNPSYSNYIATWENGKNSWEQSASLPHNLTFTKAVAFDPTGCGKRNHIAILGYLPNGDNTNGAAYVYIINAETKTLVKEYELDKDWFTWASDLDTVDANNFFSITAGDYNGDGRDSLIVYNNVFRGSKWENALKELIYDGSEWKDIKYISVTRSNNELFNTDYMNSGLPNLRTGLGEHLQVALETGDTNGDRIDDLVVVSCAGDIDANLSEATYRASVPMVVVAEGKEGTNNIGECIVRKQLWAANGNTTIAAPDVSVGDIDGDGSDEIVVAGFYSICSSSDSVKFEKGRAIYFVYEEYTYAGTTAFHEAFHGYLSQDKGTLSSISAGDSLREKESTWQQFSVECVNFDGLGSKDYVFLNGYIYEYNGEELFRASGSDSLDNTDSKNQDDDHFAFNFLVTECNGTDVNEVFIRSVAAGNTRASSSGKEVLNLIVGFKTNKNNRYFLKAITIYKDDSGSWHMEGAANTYMMSDTYTTAYNAGTTFFSLVDIHDDSVIVRYNSTKSAHTDPNVVAFLQAAPYYSEFGAGNSSTTYSYSESYSSSTISGTELSYGVGIGASFESPAVKTEMEMVLSQTISEEFAKTLTTEYTQTFEANDHNQVIIRRTLVYLYCYDLMTGVDENGNAVFEDCGVVLTVPQHPVMTSLTMDQYEEFAEAYNLKYGAGIEGSDSYYLDLLTDELKAKYYLNNEGNPFAYADSVSDYANGFNMSKGDVWMSLSHSGGTSQLAYSTSLSTEYTKTATDGVSINMSVSVGGGFMGFGAYASVSASLESLASSGVSTAYVTTTQTGGSVQNLQDEESAYSFDWQLIGWKTEENDNLFTDVPFVGYAVKEAAAPPPCVSDLSVEYSDKADKATLTWSVPQEQEGRKTALSFEIFRTDGERVSLGTITGNAGDTLTFEVSSDIPSATYVVVAYNESTKERSIDSNEVLVVFATTEAQVNEKIEAARSALQTSIDALQAALESGQTDALQTAVAELTAAYQAADALLKEGLDADLSELEETMNAADTALQSAIDTVQANLDQAIADLTALINSGDSSNTEALNQAITDLTAAYQAADELLKAGLSADLSALEEKVSAVDTALQSAIDAVQANLDQAIANLTALINSGDSSNTEALNQAITDLTSAYQAADTLLKEEMQTDISTLEEKLKSAAASLQSAMNLIQKKLDDTTTDLENQIEDGDSSNAEALRTAIAELTAAYQAADALIQSKTAASVSSLDEKFSKEDASLQDNIDTVQKNVDRAASNSGSSGNNNSSSNTAKQNTASGALDSAAKTEDSATQSDLDELKTSAESDKLALQEGIADVESYAQQENEALRSELDELREQIALQDSTNQAAVEAMAATNEAQQSTISTLKTVMIITICAFVLGGSVLVYLYLRKKNKNS